MDILKQNKFIRILVGIIKVLFIVIIILCSIILIWYGLYCLGKEGRAKRREEENIGCYNNLIINVEKRLSVYFRGDYSKSLEGLKIEQIREGVKIADIQYDIREPKTDFERVILKDSLHLQTRDSLVFTFSDGEKIVLREFRNQAYHGGNRVFVGCYWSYCLHKNDTIRKQGGFISIF